MAYVNYLLKRGRVFLISKLNFKLQSQLPRVRSGVLVIWFNLQQYKKVRVLIFILLQALSTTSVFILKKKTKYLSYIWINLNFIFRLVYLYLSNMDITLNALFLNKGHHTLEVFLSYNKIPLISELDNFFEQFINLFSIIEDRFLGLKIYLNSSTIAGAEALLRFLKVPVLFN